MSRPAATLLLAGLAGVAGLTGGPAAAQSPAARSGFDLMSAALQAMQRDDTLNPGMLAVLDGRAAWTRPDGAAARSCADCHGPTPEARMRGVAARYPAWDAAGVRVVNLADRIDLCRTRHQLAPSRAEDHPQALAMAAAIAQVSRGLPMAPPDGAAMAGARAEGAQWWQRRLGQLDLACADCHDRLVGRRLGGAMIPPANAAGYPTYRLEWQSLGSLQRRLRNCMTGVRAEPFADGSPPMRALEAYLAGRDRGLAMEAPAVRP